MRETFFIRTVVVLACVCLCEANAGADDLSYNRDIRPILSDKCFFCHGPDENKREAELRLDVEESAVEDVIVPGNPEESALIARITSGDVEERMPPPDSGKQLSGQEIKLLTRWVRDGAKYQPYWAYERPEKHPLPPIPSAMREWPKNWIDRFIADRLHHDRLHHESLSPRSQADPATLIRRLSFDLTGLPPTVEAVKAYQLDPSEENYEQYVDRLLSSDRFGERMAVYWLDLVRFADTVGYHGDQDHNITPYRDYVIDSFNDNLPFNQFTREQLAGDLLPNSTIDQKVATGYNRMLQTSHEGGVQVKEYQAIYMADRVRNLSSVWMGATMGCCQCHDHKYDPYSTRDFYSMGAFFADVDELQHFKVGSNGLPTKRPPEISVLSKRDRLRLGAVEANILKLLADLGDKAPAENADAKLPMAAGSGDSKLAELQRLREEKKRIEASKRLTMVTQAIEPRVIRLLPRGNWLDDSGTVVLPQLPKFLNSGKSSTTDNRLSRLDLANWLTDPSDGIGGLTARVQVNRFWYLLFGTGISKSLDDFGGQGESPMHPELLDNLAVQFIEGGWNVKQMIRTIVMSRTYQQSSEWTEELLKKDPYNQLFARQSRFRLPAEMIRDQTLAISGLLVLDYGGPSIKPYQPSGYYRHLNFPKREYKPAEDAGQWRRGIYMHWQRQFLHPMLKATDAPSREECTAERPRSNTPLAALVLLNDPTFVEAARVFAEHVLLQPNLNESQRVTKVFEETLFRAPDKREREVVQTLLQKQRKLYANNPEHAEKLTRIGLTKRSETLDVQELAVWTVLARAIFNLNETITRR
ncbi:MAG TPA: DUF1553 domain-containing protein [Planctomycetaceae bacterium]|nr:DUF1553 domain-containing protein [Planctomycetaceae bacterium]